MKKALLWIWLVALLIFPFVLWILPADFFDNGEVVMCPSRALLDIECLGCGMTRAVMHMHHFEFVDATFFNMGVVVIYPALVIAWFILVKKALQQTGLWDRIRPQKASA
jgi:hypothetical protein